jgi:hypothetical protein
MFKVLKFLRFSWRTWRLGGEIGVVLIFVFSFPVLAQTSQDSWSFLPAEPLFAPIIADPREPHTSITAYGNKNDFEGAVGTMVELVRYKPMDDTEWGWGLFGAGYILLSENGATFPMQAGDWYAGTYVSEKSGPFSFRLEFEHQSAHLGDAFDGTTITPIFYSRENFNLTSSYDAAPWLRFYANLGFWENIAPPDKLFFASLGTEIYSPTFSFLGAALRGYGTYNLKHKEEAGGVNNQTIQMGLQLKAHEGDRASVRLALVYYNGNAEFGQFYLQHDEHWGTAVYFDP